MPLVFATCTTLCLSEALQGPSTLQFTDSTIDSLRFQWSPAGGQVTGYLIQYTPISGLGQPVAAERREVGLGRGQIKCAYKVFCETGTFVNEIWHLENVYF